MPTDANIFPSETPGFTSPKAVIVTTNRVAPIEPGSCDVKSDATKKVVPINATIIISISEAPVSGLSSLNVYYIFPVIFVLGMSYVAISIRQLSSTEPVWLISLYFSAAITLAGLFTIPYGWLMPNLIDLILLSLIGIFGGVANLWLSQSYKFSEVSLVTPLKYLALVFAIIFGYFIWDEIPTIKTLVGATSVSYTHLTLPTICSV